MHFSFQSQNNFDVATIVLNISRIHEAAAIALDNYNHD